MERAQIVRAYSGRAGCMCGCRGNYTEKPGVITRLWANAQALINGTHPNGGELTDVLEDEAGKWVSIGYKTAGGADRTLAFYNAEGAR